MEHSSAKSDDEIRRNEVAVPGNVYFSTHYPAYQNEETILDYWRIICKYKWQVIVVTILATTLAVAVSLYFPKKYKSTATIMPLTSKGSGGIGGIASQISSIPLIGSQLGSLGGLGGGKTKELVNILKSRNQAEIIIKKFDLMRVIFAKRFDSATNSYRPNAFGVVPILEDAIEAFQKKITSVEEDKKSGLVKIEVKLKDKVLAAKIANQMVINLQDFINNNSLTISKRNRIFLEGQLVKNGAKLLEAGKELNNFYAQNKISSVVPQLDVNVGTYESVPDALQSFQEQLNAVENARDDVNKRKELAKVQGVPGQIYLQYLTLNRELISKSHALLTQQYELAKIEESKEDLAFQVIDKAEVMERPYFPKMIINVPLGFLAGGLLGIFLAFFREYLCRLKEKEMAHH